MELSIIIVNYNTKELLKKCLESVYKSYKSHKTDKIERKWEIIVVDNGSIDGSMNWLKAQGSRLRRPACQSEAAGRGFGGQARLKAKLKIIENKENVGFGRANNQAAKIVKGEYFLFLNTDTEVLNNGIERLLEFIKRNKQVGVIGGKLYNKDMTAQASCGLFYSLPVIFATLFLKGDRVGITRWSPNQLREVDWVSGACFLMRKKDFEKLGGFDEKIFMYMEEVELMYRAKKGGMRIFFYPEAGFIHLGAATSKNLTDPILNIYRGLLYFYEKHKVNWEVYLLKIMLKFKAILTYGIGLLFNNAYLKKTYAKAYKLACHV